MTKPKKQKQSFTYAELQEWAAAHVMNGLLDNYLRGHLSAVVDMAITWGRQNPKPTE